MQVTIYNEDDWVEETIHLDETYHRVVVGDIVNETINAITKLLDKEHGDIQYRIGS